MLVLTLVVIVLAKDWKPLKETTKTFMIGSATCLSIGTAANYFGALWLNPALAYMGSSLMGVGEACLLYSWSKYFVAKDLRTAKPIIAKAFLTGCIVFSLMSLCLMFSSAVWEMVFLALPWCSYALYAKIPREVRRATEPGLVARDLGVLSIIKSPIVLVIFVYGVVIGQVCNMAAPNITTIGWERSVLPSFGALASMAVYCYCVFKVDSFIGLRLPFQISIFITLAGLLCLLLGYSEVAYFAQVSGYVWFCAFSFTFYVSIALLKRTVAPIAILCGGFLLDNVGFGIGTVISSFLVAEPELLKFVGLLEILALIALSMMLHDESKLIPFLKTESSNIDVDGTLLVALCRIIALEYDLTDKQAEVLELSAQGKRPQDIGRILGISTSTVRTHISWIYRKLDVHSHAELIAFVNARS